jgi:hypothetical protein
MKPGEKWKRRWCTCRDYDRLIRYSLLLPKNPAVILLSAATITPGPNLTLFHHIPENDKLILGQYYGVPMLSVRGASYHHAQTLHMSARANETAPHSSRAKHLAAKVRPDLGPENLHRCLFPSLPHSSCYLVTTSQMVNEVHHGYREF